MKTETLNEILSVFLILTFILIMKTLNQTRTEKIEAFFAKLDKQIELNDNLINYVDIKEIDFSDAFNSIYEMVNDNGGFNCDVIYYSNAIRYLQENDPSLKESLEIAAEYGYEVKNLNSEILASLLNSQNVRDEFLDFRDEINEFFESL